MEKIKLVVFKFLLHKYALGYVVKLWESIKGYKTQICIGLWVVVFLLEQSGSIDSALSEQIRTGLEVAGGFSLMQKLQRYKPYIDELKGGAQK